MYSLSHIFIEGCTMNFAFEFVIEVVFDKETISL
jgi:hypothetical protein